MSLTATNMMPVLPRSSVIHWKSPNLQWVLLHASLPVILFLVCPIKGYPSVDSICPQFCFCSDNFVSCTDFSFLDLSMIPQSADTLVLTNGEVEEIPPAFLATAPNLKILEINSVYTRVLRGHAFIGLNRLQLLTISGSTFDIVEPDSFSNISEIVKFEIVDSKFGRLGKHAFGHITNIAEFNIWSNTFEAFTAEAFVGLKNVERFQLIRNNISQIGSDLFKNAHGVSKITVYQNKIGQVAPGSMETLAQISTRMVFKGNIFHCTCDLAWMLEQPSLEEYMDFNECSFTRFEQKANPDNTFKLSEINNDVLCVAQEEGHKQKMPEVGSIDILPEDTQSIQYAYVPYFDEDLDVMGKVENVHLQERIEGAKNKLLKPENSGTSSTFSTKGNGKETYKHEIVLESNKIEPDEEQKETSEPRPTEAITPKDKEWTFTKDNVATVYGLVQKVDNTNTGSTDAEFTEKAKVLDSIEISSEFKWSEDTLEPSPATSATGQHITLTTILVKNEINSTSKSKSSFEQSTGRTTETKSTVESIYSSNSTPKEDGESETISPILETFDVDISKMDSFGPHLSQSEQSRSVNGIFELPDEGTADAAQPAVNDIVTQSNEWYIETGRGFEDEKYREGHQPYDTQKWDLGLHMRPERLNSEAERDSATAPAPVCVLWFLSLVTLLMIRS